MKTGLSISLNVRILIHSHKLTFKSQPVSVKYLMAPVWLFPPSNTRPSLYTFECAAHVSCKYKVVTQSCVLYRYEHMTDDKAHNYSYVPRTHRATAYSNERDDIILY